MRNIALAAIVTLLATAGASGQTAVKPVAGAPTGPADTAANPSAVKPQAKSEAKPEPKPAASTPESRTAAALALSAEPTFDESSAQRIREAALSYSAIAVRGGWPTIPADARFALGVAGPQDDLLRRRLIVTGD